jgi:hypothetical protein
VRREQRRVGRSDADRRRTLAELERLWEAEHRRHHQTVEQLRRARALLEERLSSGNERRRAEDRIRDDYHDSSARIVKPRKKRP